MLLIIGYIGWRMGSYVLVACAAAAVTMVWLLMRDKPADVGLEPYNEGPGADKAPTATSPRLRSPRDR